MADAERTSATSLPPSRFGKYTLLRKIATGGMAEIFLAIQRSKLGIRPVPGDTAVRNHYLSTR